MIMVQGRLSESLEFRITSGLSDVRLSIISDISLFCFKIV